MHGNTLIVVLIWIGILIACVIGLVIHFIPAIIAFKRDHQYKWPILIINVFLGWTVIAWALDLAWAAWPEPKRPISGRYRR